MPDRCPVCGRRLCGTSLVAHRYSGRCAARPAAPAGIKPATPRPRRTFTIDRPEPEHGTRSRYNSLTYRCRCEPCTRAATAYIAERRRDPAEHERYLQYQAACRARARARKAAACTAR